MSAPVTEPAFPPQITTSAARASAASLVEEYVRVGDLPALTAVDLLDGVPWPTR